jgi:FKBP-type peptidyl-prolyl cis-trans isomerase FklB
MQPRLTLFLCACLFSMDSFAANTLAYTAPQPVAAAPAAPASGTGAPVPVSPPAPPPMVANPVVGATGATSGAVTSTSNAVAAPAPANGVITPTTPAADKRTAVAKAPVAATPSMETVSASNPTSVAATTTVSPGADKRTAAAKMPVAVTPGMETVSATSPKTISDEKDKISYAIGVDMGVNLKAQNIVVNPEMLTSGLKDGLAGGRTLVSQQEIANTLATLQKQIIAKREADYKAQADQNKRSGEAFLQLNKSKPGVVALPSGLQYRIVTQGNGIQPTDKDTVTVNYVGTLLNGQEFDSSYRRGKPVTFPVAEMIPGWAEALRLMKAGSTWDVYVPATLAYGERGLPGGPIGPNQTLAFKINLISVAKK